MNEFSNLSEVYGNDNNRSKIYTPDSNPIPTRVKKNNKVEENMRYEGFRNSLKEEQKPMRGSDMFNLDERMKETIQQHKISMNQDNESVISMETDLSTSTNSNTVVFGQTDVNPSMYQEINNNPNYMLMENELINNSMKNDYEYGKNERTQYEEVSKTSTDLFGGKMLNKLMEKIDMVITKLNSENEEERRSVWEMLIHVLLYFLTGVLVIIILSYVFNLGKQNIKISLVK
jgi:hypothetical protein